MARGERPSEEQRQREQLNQRVEALRLPMQPLRKHVSLQPPAESGATLGSYRDPYWKRVPETVGIGADGEVAVLWGHQARGGWGLTRHDAQGSVQSTVSIHSPQHPHFVQPLPDGHTLVVEARSTGGSRGGENATVYNADGRWVRAAHLGDAIEHVLTTASGAVWVGYFDEAAATATSLGGHGLALFSPDLVPEWLYPYGTDLPTITDCTSLNITGDRAWAHVYAGPYHLLSVEGGDIGHYGVTPARGAGGFLVDGSSAVLIGGYGADYDVLTPITITPDGIELAGASSRLVMPDGMELPQQRMKAKFTCRGPELHVLVDTTLYRLGLDDLTTR